MRKILTLRLSSFLSGALFTSCLALMLAAPSSALAQAEHNHNHEPAVTVAGKLFCTSCNLKKSNDAHAQCSIYGCQFAFKTDSVTNEKGKRVKEQEGKTYQIMLNDQSKALAAKDHKGSQFNLQARIYQDDGVIEVVSFEPAKK